MCEDERHITTAVKQSILPYLHIIISVICIFFEALDQVYHTVIFLDCSMFTLTCTLTLNMMKLPANKCLCIFVIKNIYLGLTLTITLNLM